MIRDTHAREIDIPRSDKFFSICRTLRHSRAQEGTREFVSKQITGSMFEKTEEQQARGKPAVMAEYREFAMGFLNEN